MYFDSAYHNLATLKTSNAKVLKSAAEGLYLANLISVILLSVFTYWNNLFTTD